MNNQNRLNDLKKQAMKMGFMLRHDKITRTYSATQIGVARRLWEGISLDSAENWLNGKKEEKKAAEKSVAEIKVAEPTVAEVL